MRHEYLTSINGEVVYRGESLEEAIRTWDSKTYMGRSAPPGGVSVRTLREDGSMVRDGWVLHVREHTGSVYLNPRLVLK